MPTPAATGRPRQFCRAGCRQQAHIARRLASHHGLGDDDAIVDRRQLEAALDAQYCLQAAIEDVEADLAEADDPAEVERALAWLLEHARASVEAQIEVRAAHLST